MRRLLAVAAAALLTAGCTGDPGVDGEPRPVVTVTAVPVEVTPASCRQALEAADRMLAATGQGYSELVLEAARAGVTAGASGDEAQLAAITAEVEQVAAVVEAERAKYDPASQACRDGRS